MSTSHHDAREPFGRLISFGGGAGTPMPAFTGHMPVMSSAVAAQAPVDFRFYEPGITPIRYPVLYLLFIVAATLDIALTWVILSLGGIEVNPIAAMVIHEHALNGAIAYKYALTVFVIILCEAVGRHRDRAGRLLAVAAVAISSVPVVWSTSLLASLWLWL